MNPLMPTQYQRGRSFEYRVRNDLRDRSWFVVRSAQSRTPADLVAFKGSRKPLFIQCKNNGVISIEEWNELYDLATSVGAVPVIAEKGAPGIKYSVIYGPRSPRVYPPRQAVDIDETY
jgi:Holliday junction resolvase